jgi:D-glycero-alpha-D-manno-heptose-7-phosphate kinase
MLIRARAPLRLGLAGGGTDVAPYCDLHGGHVLNVTIDQHAYAVLRPRPGAEVTYIAADQQWTEVTPASADAEFTGKLKLHHAVYTTMMQQFNNDNYIGLDMHTFCDAPPGSGLGSSSTLVVAMIKALAELLKVPLDDYAIAQLAYKIEREDCKLLGGKQDQYSAAFGGFNFMEFYAENRTIVNPLRIKNWIVCELEASLILFYSGVSRESAKIIADQKNNVSNPTSGAMEAMHGLRREAMEMKECLLKADFGGMVDSMRMGWENKKRSSKSVSNPLIDEIYGAAIEAGASAGKVSGAGGGGFMMFFVPPEKRLKVMRTLSTFDGQVSTCHFSEHGCQAWRVE